MSDQRLRELLEEASSEVPPPNLAGPALAGARRLRTRSRAATGVAVVVTAGVLGAGLAGFSGDGAGLVAGQPGDELIAEEAPVEDGFECPNTLRAPAPDMPEIYGDGPDLGVGNLGASRYEIVTEDGHRVLKVGDAEGNLTARVNLVPGNDSPVIGAYERCTGPLGDDVPTAGRFELGAHGRPFPAPPREMFERAEHGPAITSTAVPLDDRPYYNRIGIETRRTLYGFETREGAGFVEVDNGRLAGSSWWEQTEGAGDYLGPNFIPSGDPIPHMAGFDFAGWAYYTTGEATLSGRLTDGSAVVAETFRAEDWRGTLHVLLAPTAELETVVVEEGGRKRTIPARRD